MSRSFLVKCFQQTGRSAKVYPKPLKGYENGEAPEFLQVSFKLRWH